MAVLTRKAFITESVSANQTITTIDFYSKVYLITTSATDITITLPFAGGGAYNGTNLHFINVSGSKNLIITYQSGVSITLKPTESTLITFDGAKWDSIKANKVLVEKYLKFLNSGTEKSFIATDADGSLILYVNCYEDENGVIKLATTDKRARRFRLEGSDGIGYWDYSQIASAGTIASWTVAPLLPNGYLSGSLEFQSTTLPPIVKSGDREGLGILHHLAADYNMAMSDYFQNSWATFDTYQWYRVVMDSRDGTFKYVHAFDTHSGGTPTFVGSLSDIAVTSIVVTSGTAVCNTANTTGLIVANGHVVVVKGSDAGIIVGRITAVNAGVSFSVKTSKADGTYTAGTYSAYYRILTLHGGATSVVSDPDVEKFTPSPLFCAELNGYYLDSAGVPTSSASLAVYRQLGVVYVHTGPVVEYVISYKSGFDKNDNYFDIACASDSPPSTNTNVIRWNGTLYKIWGNNYTFVSSASNGDSFLMNCNLEITGSLSIATNATNESAFCKHGTTITNSIAGGIEDLAFGHVTVGTEQVVLPIPATILNKGEYVWASNTGVTFTEASTATRWHGKFEI